MESAGLALAWAVMILEELGWTMPCHGKTATREYLQGWTLAQTSTLLHRQGEVGLHKGCGNGGSGMDEGDGIGSSELQQQAF